jgi:hypothetical protein
MMQSLYSISKRFSRRRVHYHACKRVRHVHADQQPQLS